MCFVYMVTIYHVCVRQYELTVGVIHVSGGVVLLAILLIDKNDTLLAIMMCPACPMCLPGSDTTPQARYSTCAVHTYTSLFFIIIFLAGVTKVLLTFLCALILFVNGKLD